MPRSNNRGASRARIAGTLLCVTVLCAGISGCVAGPNFLAPPAPTATSYTADALAHLGASHTRLDSTQPEPDEWWALLDSPRLDTTIRQALAANRSLDAARSTLAEAQSNSYGAEAGRYPHVDLDAGAHRGQVDNVVAHEGRFFWLNSFLFDNFLEGGANGACGRAIQLGRRLYWNSCRWRFRNDARDRCLSGSAERTAELARAAPGRLHRHHRRGARTPGRPEAADETRFIP